MDAQTRISQGEQESPVTQVNELRCSILLSPFPQFRSLWLPNS